jgi:hypothetical protein
MNLADLSASIGAADSARAAEQLDSALDASLLSLPPTRMAVDARGLPLGILAVLATVFYLSWAQNFVVPLLVGIVISYTLNPLVTWLEAIKIPRVVGTVIVMGSVIGAGPQATQQATGCALDRSKRQSLRSLVSNSLA